MPIEDEIGDMIKSLSDNTPTKPEPEPKKEEKSDDNGSVVETPVVAVSNDSEKESKTAPEKVAGDTSSTTNIVEEPEPKVESKVEEPKPDEKDQIIADLRAKLAEKEVVKVEPRVEPKVEPKLADQDFVGELDLDDLTRDPKKLNEVLNKVYQKAAEDVRKGIITEIPEVVKTNIAIMNNIRESSEKFYTENPDLKKFPKVVAAVFDELAAADPNKKFDELMSSIGPEVRRRLDLPKQDVVTPKSDKKDPPRLPHKGSKPGKVENKPSLDPLQAELEEMTKTLRG